MAQISGAQSTKDYFRGKRPWSYRKTAIPKKTWCGVVVYKRKKQRFWTMRDVARISAKVEIIEDSADFIEKLMEKLREATEAMLGKILPFLSDEQVTKLYDWVYMLLAEIFNVQPDIPYNQAVIDIIYSLATRAGYEVTLKKR